VNSEFRIQNSERFVRQLHTLLPVLGAVLVSVTSIVGSGFSPLALAFVLWSAIPYGVLWLVARVARNPWPVVGAGSAALAAELGIRAAVFLWPRGSTAAVALVFSPFYILAVVMPAGAVLGWLFGRLWRWHALGRAMVTIATPVLLGLLTLGLARPELFPTAVIKRRALLERVGPPRVVSGSAAFESIPIPAKPGWYVAAELDGRRGEEIAVVDHHGAAIFDAATLEPLEPIAFPTPLGRLWGSFSTLIRLPSGRMAVAQTGGGFSRTLVQDLDGTTLWEHHPDRTLAPTAMRPADLDGDGRLEFYASSNDFTARLDADGREVWRRDTKMASLVTLLPRIAETPAWVVALEYGRKLWVWDEAGRVLAERETTAENPPLAAVDSAAGRAVVHGGRSARGYDLQGRPLFDVALGDFTLSQAIGARLSSDGEILLVLVAATDRDTKRWRLLIVDAESNILYEEVLDQFPRVFAARRADGSDALLVGGTAGLRVLRMK
jgi:hypothetical protein